MEHIYSIKENLLIFLEEATPTILVNVLTICSTKYYNTDAELITDEEYDRLYEKLEEIEPSNDYFKQVGTNVNDDKVILPYWIGSMNKKKTQEEVEKWYSKYPGEVVISDKLDGKSFILEVTELGKKIYSRGNGNEGKDISYLLDYIEIPNVSMDLVIRGEILISKENFKKIKGQAKNTRSFISGISNLKKIDEIKEHDLKLVDLICFEVISPPLSPYEQLKFLKDNNFKVVDNTIKECIDFKFLETKLLERKSNSKYDIDGIIVCQNKLYPRTKDKNPKTTDKNPKHAIAFKMDMEFAISNVLDIVWNLSKHGKLKPLVLIEPVSLNGTTVKAATGNNAAFIKKHKLGPGAKVKIIKSGEIIPKIIEVYGGIEPKMPECEYEWNSTEKEVLMINMEDNEEVKIKRITCFFKTIGVEHIGPGIYKKLYNNGYNSINKIINISKEELMTLPGIKEKSSNNIFENIKKILSKPIKVEKVVSGSCIMGTGLGIKILEKIIKSFPNIFSEEIEIFIEQLVELPSIEEKTAQRIITNLSNIRNFIKEHPKLKLETTKKKKKIIKKKFITGKNIVITGKRDKSVLEYIEEYGGNLQQSINKHTDILIADDKDGKGYKIKKAKELNIEIYNYEEFKIKYHH
tara:strand:- start:283 stop:2184 length:1902 start_codon:yes stop_codon:yes gene_type:complete